MYTSRPLQPLVAISVIFIVQAAWRDIHRFDSQNLAIVKDSQSQDTTPTPGKDVREEVSNSTSHKPSYSAPQPSSSRESPPITQPRSSSIQVTFDKKPDLTSPLATSTPPKQTSKTKKGLPNKVLQVSSKLEVVTRVNMDDLETTQSTLSAIKSTPGVNKDKDLSLSTNTRNTIISLVVGICSVIIIGALGIVVLRIRGRKKKVRDNAVLMDCNTGSTDTEKPDGTNQQRSPFQSTLESYHQPTADVSTS